MDQDEIKDIDTEEEEEDADFIPKKKAKSVGKDDEEITGDLKDSFDDEFLEDDSFEDEENGYYINEDGEDADEWEDVYGFKDEYES